MTQRTNLIINQGTTFTTSFNISDENGDPMDFTGHTGLAQIRRTYESNTAVPFTVSLDNQGNINLFMAANVTATLEATRHVYDVITTDSNGTVMRMAEGLVTVTPRVSKI